VNEVKANACRYNPCPGSLQVRLSESPVDGNLRLRSAMPMRRCMLMRESVAMQME
jgi:hypothetical protein